MINHQQAFLSGIQNAQSLAEQDRLVTLGIVPDKPETGYSYIRKGENLGDTGFCVSGFSNLALGDLQAMASDPHQSELERLPEIIHGEGFKSEMARFLPMDVQERTFMKDKFCDYPANEIRGLLDEVRQGMSVNPNTGNQFES